MENKRILILYAEVMGYVISAINNFIDQHGDFEILLIELDKKKLTIFNFTPKRINYKQKSTFPDYLSFKNYCIQFNPELVLVSGRMDSDYLKISKFFKKSGIYTVTLQDTQYSPTLRQYLISKLAFFLYHQYFSGFWGTGDLQTAFALRLGYDSENIFKDFYTADSSVFQYNYEIKHNNYKVFLYVGRLVKEKNILSFANQLDSVNSIYKTNHKLIIIGDGYLKDDLSKIKCTELYPFKSANDIINISKNADIFCIPSTYEPWGVVLDEFCKLGFPIISSNRCGASRNYVINGFNGFLFNPNDEISMFNTLVKVTSLNSEQLLKLSEASKLLSLRNNLSIWSATLFMIFNHALEFNGNRRISKK